MKSNDTIAALIQPHEFTEMEIWTFSIGFSMIGLGLLFVILSTAIEYCIINQQVNKTMEMHDAMIRPPRCDSKAREIGMETGTNWKHYFYRAEAFYET